MELQVWGEAGDRIENALDEDEEAQVPGPQSLLCLPAYNLMWAPGEQGRHVLFCSEACKCLLNKRSDAALTVFLPPPSLCCFEDQGHHRLSTLG